MAHDGRVPPEGMESNQVIGPEEISNRFGYHPATADTAPQHDSVRQAYMQLAHWLDDFLPDGRDKATALTHLESSMHWANAAIAMTTPIASDGARARQ